MHAHHILMASKGINSILLSFSCFILLMGPCYSETATLLQGQQLNYGEELVSANGLFRLGFFNPEFTNKSYLGIWYNSPKAALDPPQERPVWVANRNTPILGDSGILTIDGTDGNLKISHDGGDPVVLTWVGGVTNNTSATLLDSGNLVLHEHNLDGSIKQVLWQSFDYPTDSFLPGMKLGIDLNTGLNRSLTSWRSNQSPDSGSFILGMDPNGTNQLVIWWRGDIFWTSGHWHNGRFGLSDLFAAEDDTVYNFSYISNENETYFKYSVNQDVVFFPKLKISEEGDLIDYYDRSALHCEPFSVNSSIGCVQQKLPECRISDSNYFFHHMGFMSGEGLIVSESDNFTLADCEAKCTNNCSCVAYASKNSDGTGCEYWSSKSGFKESTSDGWRDIYILKSKTKAETWWIWLMVTTGGALIILLVCSSYVIWRECKAKGVQKRKQKLLLSELGGNTMASTTYDGVESHKKDGNELHIFSFERIAAATNNFSTANKLGEGGYGPVYKGKLLDGREVAIKRLSRSSGQGLVEFKNEAILIAKLQHTNLVRLLGFCIQEEEKILIYEYMSNKSLDLFLFDCGKKNILNWKKRLIIIEGIAQGLIYLHKFSRLRVIHRDLKASNILLDDDMNPKISDFGMARIFGVNESQANTNRVVGTYGYMSPEYAMNGIVSTKTDVFSFGVLLLEIVSNKKNNSCYQSGCALNLVGYAWQLWNEGRGLELIDPALDEFCPHNEFLRCIHVGLLCVQYHAIDRPTMSEVVSMLSNDTISLPIPKQPAFFIVKVVEELEAENYSINHVSISEMDAR